MIINNYNIISYCIKAIKIISILDEIFTLALDLKINQFKLDMNDVNDLNKNNKDIILNNDEYSDEYRFDAHSDEKIILMDMDINIKINHLLYFV